MCCMRPVEESARTLPPDRHLDGMDGANEDGSIMLMVSVEMGSIGGNVNDVAEASSGTRGKVQRKGGSYSGEVTLVPREQEWMVEGDTKEGT